MSRGAKESKLTVPELAKALGVSDQTVRRWVRNKQVPFTRNADGWALIRLEDVPADLVDATKKHSGARYRPAPPSPTVDPMEEIAWLRTQLDRAIGIIATLSEGDEVVTPLSRHANGD